LPSGPKPGPGCYNTSPVDRPGFAVLIFPHTRKATVSRSRRVLVVGSGGREHAIAWKLARDGAEVLVAPGNAGTAAEGENVPIPATDIPALVALARRREVDLTVVGPEAPLVAGIVDAFQGAGLRIFGPTQAAARIEGSKLFCKQILHRGDVPTAMYREFRSPARAREYLEAREDAPSKRWPRSAVTRSSPRQHRASSSKNCSTGSK